MGKLGSEYREQDQKDRSTCLFFTLLGLHIWRSAAVFFLVINSGALSAME